MNTHLSKYFYIIGFQSSPDQTLIDHLTGNYTDRSHSMFLPPKRISRTEALSMIKAGIVVFVENRKIRPTTLKIVSVANVEYLRLDGESIPRDEIGDFK